MGAVVQLKKKVNDSYNDLKSSVDQKISIERVVEKMCHAPAKCFKVNKRLDIDNIRLRLFLMNFEWINIKYMK